MMVCGLWAVEFQAGHGADVQAIQEMYKRFVTECPSGLLFLHEFKRFFGVDPTGEASDDAENIFRAFDRNESLYRIKKGIKTDMCDPQLSADEVADRILRAVDSDGDGHINLQEFIRGAQGDPWVLNMLQLDMNPAGWVLEQRRGSAHF
ncbi:guanylyl cyclase-activating protein 2-like [Pseudoliparis swirei]|uniref:guanylyl cyclase-activating protein 2-like n=1 Tax=Pseudoliparis swirei TaxID=2059687 RepID=UPI0024BE9805|nr:guanylyl cyclase-activating protein 2-like [Pseudoliparis swirei]